MAALRCAQCTHFVMAERYLHQPARPGVFYGYCLGVPRNRVSQANKNGSVVIWCCGHVWFRADEQKRNRGPATSVLVQRHVPDSQNLVGLLHVAWRSRFRRKSDRLDVKGPEFASVVVGRFCVRHARRGRERGVRKPTTKSAYYAGQRLVLTASKAASNSR